MSSSPDQSSRESRYESAAAPIKLGYLFDFVQPDALVHCDFGFGIVFVNPALAALGWDPPCCMGTAFQNAWINPVIWQAIMGWIGLDQYDEENPIGQQFLDRYQDAYDRRPEYCVSVVNRDLATLLLHAFADAHPLTPRGVKEALERIKLLPAASGSPGTRLSFGKWIHRGWVGSGYLVARTTGSRRNKLTPGRALRPGPQRTMINSRIVIVGAGALGVVTAHHLREAGADISFYVRPQRVHDLSRPQRLYAYQ